MIKYVELGLLFNFVVSIAGEIFDVHVLSATSTSDGVHITLFGPKATSPMLRVNPGQDMVDGEWQLFEVDCTVDVGGVDSVKVEIDGDDSWQMRKMKLVGRTLGIGFFFECDPACEFDKPANVGQGEAVSRMFTPTSSSEVYSALMATKDGGETSSEVKVTLKGTSGQSSSMVLNPAGQSLTKSDTRIIVADVVIGELQNIIITLVGSDDWYLEQVTLTHISRNRTWIFKNVACPGCRLASSGSNVQLTAQLVEPPIFEPEMVERTFARVAKNRRFQGSLIAEFSPSTRRISKTGCAIFCTNRAKCNAFNVHQEMTSTSVTSCQLLNVELPIKAADLEISGNWSFYEMILNN